MSHKNKPTPISYLEELFSHELLQLAPPQTEEPEYEALVFFEKIPPALLQRRKDAVASQSGFEEWFLVTEKPGGAEWLSEMQGAYSIGVVAVDNLQEAHQHLSSLAASEETFPRRSESSYAEDYHPSK